MKTNLSIGLGKLLNQNGELPNSRANNSDISGIRSRKNFRRFIFLVKGNEDWSSPKGHIASIYYPGLQKEKLKTKEQKGNPSRSDVQVFCTCPAFQYWGAHYWSTQEDYLMFDKPNENRFPDIRDPNHQYSLCKHLAKVAIDIKKFSFIGLIKEFGGQTNIFSSSDAQLKVIEIEECFPTLIYLLEQGGNDSETISLFINSLNRENFEDELEKHNLIVSPYQTPDMDSIIEEVLLPRG